MNQWGSVVAEVADTVTRATTKTSFARSDGSQTARWSASEKCLSSFTT
ncbi:hypothetical protein [Dictyobacter arantiisoli]|nr:hypothetical protein [Dictyobacter arantiisoli]